MGAGSASQKTSRPLRSVASASHVLSCPPTPTWGTVRPSGRTIDFFLCSRALAEGARADVIFGAPVAPHRPARLVLPANHQPSSFGFLPEGPAAYPKVFPLGYTAQLARAGWEGLCACPEHGAVKQQLCPISAALDAELADRFQLPADHAARGGSRHLPVRVVRPPRPRTPVGNHPVLSPQANALRSVMGLIKDC